MVAKEPGHQGEREVSRKAIAQGVPDVSALPDNLVCTSTLQHTRLRVRPAPGIPCALCVSRGTPNCKTRTRNRAAGMQMHVIASDPQPGLFET